METNFNTISIEPRSQDSAAAPSTTKRRFGTNGGLWYLNRAIVYTLYLPIIFAARLFLNTARLHGEARSISIIQDLIELPRLPAVFQGLRIAFLTDFHCGPLTPASFLERVVDETLKHKPDVILLGGDYVTDGADYIHAIEQVLARLDAPLGVYGVLGNHEFESDVEAVRRALRRAGVVELTNRGCWLERGDSRIRIAGVGDLWCDEQDLSAALAGTERSDTVVLLSHNPDYVMEIDDPRVGLVLSGHTHGGQVQLPRLGPLFTNSRHGKRLVQGRVSIPPLQLYVSRGIGTVMVPFRYKCPPEITLLTLCSPRSAESE